MSTSAEDLRSVLAGERPSRMVAIDPTDPPYALITYRGALPPPSGGIDLWGVVWSGTGESLPYPTQHPAATFAEALHLPLPNLDDPALWQPAEAQAAAVRGRRLLIGRQVCTLFERMWSLVGMEEAMVGLVSSPDEVAALLDRILAWQLALAERLIALGLDAARISDDYGAQTGLLMRPATWRWAIGPRLARLIGRYHEAGLPVILHSCGNIGAIMDDLVDMGIAAFNIQSSANDLLALRRRYGKRFRVWGGISTQTTLAAGTPETVRETVLRIGRELGPEGLILDLDQTIAVPAENLSAYLAAVAELKAS